MRKITRADILGLEQYAEQRAEIREKIIAYKKSRSLRLGPHVLLYFEDRLTMQYQIQEMLRAEKIFESAGIQEEIDTYNELVPDGCNWKATMLFEYEDVAERERELRKLVGIEDNIFVQVGSGPKILVHANDDMPRSNEYKTAAVHFLRFEFGKQDVESIRNGASVSLSIDHPLLPYSKTLHSDLLGELSKDFNS